MYSIIIVDYNSIPVTIQYISECISKIEEQEECRFIVVDNYPKSNIQVILSGNKKISPENKVMWNDVPVLKCYYENHEIYFLCVNENLGYARGNNIGLRYAREVLKDKYVIISNNDISFTKSISLLKMKNILESKNNIAVVGPKVTGIDGMQQSPYKKKGIGYTIFRTFLLYFLIKIFPINIKNHALDYNATSKECYWVSGCFFLADSMKMQNAGDFDENTFLYAEEMILSERLKKKNLHMYFCDDVEVIHEGSHTINKNLKDMEAEEALFNSYIYYFEQYRKENCIVVFAAKLYFKFIKLLFKIGQRINQIKKSGKNY